MAGLLISDQVLRVFLGTTIGLNLVDAILDIGLTILLAELHSQFVRKCMFSAERAVFYRAVLAWSFRRCGSLGHWSYRHVRRLIYHGGTIAISILCKDHAEIIAWIFYDITEIYCFVSLKYENYSVRAPLSDHMQSQNMEITMAMG